VGSGKWEEGSWKWEILIFFRILHGEKTPKAQRTQSFFLPIFP
jgi:hypothetical protein